MRRREAALARVQNRSEENLFETDYLLGVYDGHRMGALRFKLEKDGPFLDHNKDLASPPWTSVSELERISLRLEGDDIIDDPDYLKWLKMLIAPGTSLGGARPKANIVYRDDSVWIAKFPSKKDQFNVGAWEMVVHELAIESGINMPESRIEKFSRRYHTYLSKRFDRLNTGHRIHFASALTLLGYSDGVSFSDGVKTLKSYGKE